jgi:ABC-type antimicrobial peptide transport system permease subunit
VSVAQATARLAIQWPQIAEPLIAPHWAESMLFGLKATDPAAIGGAIVLLVAAAQLAAYLPARRASHVNPLEALRHG